MAIYFLLRIIASCVKILVKSNGADDIMKGSALNWNASFSMQILGNFWKMSGLECGNKHPWPEDAICSG